MRSQYNLLRTRKGRTSFARATVSSTPSDTWSTTLTDQVQAVARAYGAAIEAGVSLALAEQERRNGPKFVVVVVELLETLVDTSLDAVECAVGAATWMSFGHREEEVQITHDGDRWRFALEPRP